MSYIYELSNEQINEAVSMAAQKHVPVSITVRAKSRWVNYHSRAIVIHEGHFWIELPITEASVAPHEFAPAEKVGLSFKLKHHKHIFTGTVASLRTFELADGAEAPVIAVCVPTQMYRLQRRAYERVEVPSNRIVRASFWLGGCQAEPAGTSAESPVWSGRTMNISAGGFQVRTDRDAAKSLEPGDIVGVRLGFGAEMETVYADAQFRHTEPAGESVLLGFQFLGLGQTDVGKKALTLIVAKVTEFQHTAQHARSR
ncbi:MAG: PilZ domain-containing protein [Phycisphaerae bacterium]|nr:PilZ domain-containing protein [Phycisphaerae bacterium]